MSADTDTASAKSQRGSTSSAAATRRVRADTIARLRAERYRYVHGYGAPGSRSHTIPFSSESGCDQSFWMVAIDDFAGADFGDERLTKRLLRIVGGLAPKPGASLPDAAKDDTELEGTYRFLQNEKVTPEGILAPHYAATALRAHEAGVVLCGHDTTEFSFSTEREGMGRINDGGRGFFAHIALAIRADEARSPLGVIGLSTHVRRGAPRHNKRTDRIAPKERESYRWTESIDAVEARLAGHADAVHLLDSEADAYLLLEHMVQAGVRFVVRATHKRKVTAADGDRLPLADALARVEVFVERRPEGDFAVRKPSSKRASAVEPTQAEAIARAQEMDPNATVLVERVRETTGGKPDRWRKP